MNIVKSKNIFFAISAVLIIPGLISLALFGLKLSIDFTGGSRLELQVKNEKSTSGDQIRKTFESEKIDVHSVLKEKDGIYEIRTEPIDEKAKGKVVSNLKKQGEITEKSFNTVGPTIGAETGINAFKAIIIASLAITAYIAFAFRKVSKPVASWKYGVCAIAALLHDVIIVVGFFSILGFILGVEVDSLFITALLTVMGFSVHDTIVVFDRIRENLRKNFSAKFDEVVNNSLLETINRSLNTSITVLIVLFALLVFGGESIRWFVVALLVGITAGTYSSIFNASQLLVLWHEIDIKRNQRKEKKK